MDKVREKIVNILGVMSNIDVDSITSETSLSKDLCFDSLDKVEFIMKLEKTYWMCLPDHETENLDTIGQWEEYLADKY